MSMADEKWAHAEGERVASEALTDNDNEVEFVQRDFDGLRATWAREIVGEEVEDISDDLFHGFDEGFHSVVPELARLS